MGSMRWLAIVALAVSPLSAAELKPQTVEAFDRYIKQTEQRLQARKNFLWADESARSPAAHAAERNRGGTVRQESRDEGP
jgi:hypothetical protein